MKARTACYRFALLWILLQLVGCAVNPVSGESDFVLMSEDQEIAIGRENHAKIIKRYGRYDNERLQTYVQKIGSELATNSHRTNLIFRFTVLDTNEINAFALPGGYIYITRGLIAYLANEAELAAVLAHEIGHVTARHAVRQHSAATATGILAAILASQADFQGAGDILNTAGTALVRGYGRDHELESDRLGAEYLAKSGYDPLAMLEVIRVLKNQEIYERKLAEREGREPNIYHGVFSTHPDNDKRLQEVVGRAKRLSKKSLNRSNRASFLSNIEGLVFGEGEKEGILRGNRFYHRELDVTLKLPEGWRVENRPDRLLAIAPGNQGLFQVRAMDINLRLTPKQFLEKRLKLEDLQSGESFRHRDLQGYTALSRVRTSYGTRLTRFIILFRANKAWVFQGAAKDTDRPYSYDRLFLDSARSFRNLNSKEQELARARRLHIITASKTTRFADLARESRLGANAEVQLRLLNKHYPNGEPAPGTPLKIIQ